MLNLFIASLILRRFDREREKWSTEREVYIYMFRSINFQADMANISIQLLDLPDELIVMILKKLNNIEVFHSLMGINRRLDGILFDSIFTRNLTLVRRCDKEISPLADEMLERFCLEILPKIHEKIECLTVEPLSMERIFLIDNYPNLFKLGLVNISWEELLRLLDGKISL